MKKLLSILLAAVMLFGVCAFAVSAEEEDKYAPEQYSEDEKKAGFSFKRINVVIKNEYSFEEFTPEKLGSDLIEKVEAPYEFNPDNDNYDKDSWELLLRVHLKPEAQTKENVIELYKQMKASEYAKSARVAFIYTSMPFFPETAEEVGYYSGQYRPWVSPENEAYSNNGKTMINNPYYKTYYNRLLEHSVAVYNQFAPYMGDVDYNSYFADNYMEKDVNYVTLIFDTPIDLPENLGAEKDYTELILKKYFDEDEILYVSDFDFAAVVAIDKADRDVIKEIEELAFIGDAFFTVHGMTLGVIGEYALGNVADEKDPSEYTDPDFDLSTLDKVSAADARLILRFAAGLEKPEKDLKRFYYCADMNFDGDINAYDARLALRTAAGLEPTYEIGFGYSSMWGDQMGSEIWY